ncbi:MAG TPA: hypothetical protein PKK23_16795 [Nitrospirales bacterium]|nr:hypothetical protein [Nitrospirales bacterium]
MREHQIRRCQEDSSRRLTDCVKHQPYDSYERERLASSSPSREP